MNVCARLMIVCGVLAWCEPLCAEWRFSSRESRVRFGEPNSRFILNAPMIDWKGTLQLKGLGPNMMMGSTITFSEGRLESDSLKAYLSGTYDPTSGDTIVLGATGVTGEDRMTAEPGTLVQGIKVCGTGNILEGQPLFSSAITLESNQPTAELTLALQTKLNQNITLNNGKIILNDDLSLLEGTKIVGPGTVNFNGRTLSLPVEEQTLWNTNLTFSYANKLELHGTTMLRAIWHFTDPGGEAHINGNGEILDIDASGAVIKVGANHDDDYTLYITDCYIRGMGDYSGTFSLMGPNCRVVLNNVTLGLSGDYTFKQGQLIAAGNNDYIITADHILTFTWDQAASYYAAPGYVSGDPRKTVGSFTVDKTMVLYDTLGSPLSTNIRPIVPDGEYLYFVNGGNIQAVHTSGEGGGGLVISDAIYNMTSNVYTGVGREISFIKKPGMDDWTITLNGNGYFIHYPVIYPGATNCMTLQDHLVVTLKNVVLKDYDPAFTTLGSEFSELWFGDGTVIELNRDMDLNQTWSFVGNATIDGHCATLHLNCPNAITVAEGKTLTLRDVRITGLQNGTGLDFGRINLHKTSSKLKLWDAELALSNNYTFSVGSIDVYEDSKISGRDHIFTYKSKGLTTVQSDATLMLDRGLTFSYQADFDAGVGSYQNSRNRIQFADSSGRIYLNGCTLHSTHTGLMLQTGILVVDDKVTLRSVASIDEGPYGQTPPTSGEEVEFRDTLIVEILAGAALEVDGRLRYD